MDSLLEAVDALDPEEANVTYQSALLLAEELGSRKVRDLIFTRMQSPPTGECATGPVRRPAPHPWCHLASLRPHPVPCSSLPRR